MFALLKQAQQNHFTGTLLFEQPGGQGWTLYWQEGRLSFVTKTMRGMQTHIEHQLLRQRLNIDVKGALARLTVQAVPEHALFSVLLQRRLLSRSQTFEAVTALILLAVVELLFVSEAEYRWLAGPALEPRLSAVPPLLVLREAEAQRAEWQKLQPHIHSMDQKLYIQAPDRLSEAATAELSEQLSRLLDGTMPLSTVAYRLRRKPLDLARILAPLVAQGILGDVAFVPPTLGKLVACIDDSPTIGKTVEMILARAGLRTLYIDKPLSSLSQVLRKQPALVFLDISMPEIDGYQMCKFLRRSPVMRDIPIVFLTGKDGLFDRVRANLVGANEYLTKPGQEEKLLAVLRRYGIIRPEPQVQAVPLALHTS